MTSQHYLLSNSVDLVLFRYVPDSRKAFPLTDAVLQVFIAHMELEPLSAEDYNLFTQEFPALMKPDQPIVLHGWRGKEEGCGTTFEGHWVVDTDGRMYIVENWSRAREEWGYHMQFLMRCPKSAHDWTADPTTGRSNSSKSFREMVANVEKILRESASSIVNGDLTAVAQTVVATLAHQHRLSPPLNTKTVHEIIR